MSLNVSDVRAAPLIRAVNISKLYRSTLVLDQVSLDIHPAEILTIIGPNGAGKSTLLRCLLGLETITSGEVIAAPALRIGYVPQRMMPPTNLPMNVDYFLKLYSTPDDDMLHMLGIDTWRKTPLGNLSAGQWQRVLLARALSGTPDILALDEPMQGMDIHAESECYGLIEAATQRGCAVVMVSHDLHMVMAASKRVVCLQHHICCEGTPKSVQQNPAFANLFGEAHAEKFAFYIHQHHHRHTPTGELEPLSASTAHTECGHG